MVKSYKVLVTHTVEEVVFVAALNGKQAVEIVQSLLDDPQSGGVEVAVELTETSPRMTTGAWCIDEDDDNPPKCKCGGVLKHEVDADGNDYHICWNCGAKA
jgi:hypothetical protein